MNIRKKILTRCGALLTAVLVLAPTALAAEAEIPYIPQTVPAAQLAPADQRGQEDWQLLLVNPWHTVPEGYEIKLATLSNGLQVDERIYDDLDDMLSDCREAGLNPIVCSAYRTEATQTRLYRNKVARGPGLRCAGGPGGGGGRPVGGQARHQRAPDRLGSGHCSRRLSDPGRGTGGHGGAEVADGEQLEVRLIPPYPSEKERHHRHRVRALALPVTWARRRQRTSTAPASAWRSI